MTGMGPPRERETDRQKDRQRETERQRNIQRQRHRDTERERQETETRTRRTRCQVVDLCAKHAIRPKIGVQSAQDAQQRLLLLGPERHEVDLLQPGVRTRCHCPHRDLQHLRQRAVVSSEYAGGEQCKPDVLHALPRRSRHALAVGGGEHCVTVAERALPHCAVVWAAVERRTRARERGGSDRSARRGRAGPYEGAAQ